ncbi:MAG: Gfo/Idh/MocA family oxidoreductase [Alphaproteobacteria bacterium]|nr:Gfo/Idh/MocA family oxidoreductase [Alphaproteobacteria bacterium]
MTTRRVCLVGAGFIAQVHAEALVGLKGVTLAAVVDPDTQAAEAMARRFRIPTVHASVADAIAAGGIDCAHVLVPPAAHRAAAAPFLQAGLAVLVEKPMATSAADCAALNNLAAAHGATLAVNQNFIFHPAFRRLQQAVERRRFGRLTARCFSACRPASSRAASSATGCSRRRSTSSWSRRCIRSRRSPRWWASSVR